MERWNNRVAVITGASSGIGASLAENLVKHGLIVVALARRIDRVEHIKSKLSPNEQGRFHVKFCDVSNEASVSEVFSWICSTLGGVDVLINNAGVHKDGFLATMDLKDIQTVVNTNLMGVVYCTQAAVKSMRERNFDGHIFLINSVLGHNVKRLGDTVANIYPATKFGLTAINEILRQEFNILKSKIKITSISPGLVDTEMPDPVFLSMMKDSLLKAQDITDGILYALGTPPHVQVHELTLRPVGELF
ncbi:DHRS11.2 family protein [Megaselia abdita]